VYNKQLAFTVFDSVIAAMFPELNGKRKPKSSPKAKSKKEGLSNATPAAP
jgi:hypothetical protein